MHDFEPVTSMMSVDTAWVNQVIRGKIQFRKCPSCDNEGVDLTGYNEDGEPAREGEDGVRYPCEDCEGLGYIELSEGI